MWRTHGENYLILVAVIGDDHHGGDIKIEMSVKMITMMMMMMMITTIQLTIDNY